MEAFVHDFDPKLALGVQKLGHRALNKVIATVHRIERLQKYCPSPNMDNLVSVLQDELYYVRKELKESAATIADNAVQIAQPVAASAEPVAPAPGVRAIPAGTGVSCAIRRVIL